MKTEALQKKFNRIKGQINGIEKMIAQGRESTDIVQQITAVKAALSSLAISILQNESQKCMECSTAEERLKKFEELVVNFFRINY